MGKRREKRRRNLQKPWERTRQEEEIVRAQEAKDAEFRKRVALEAKNAELRKRVQKRSRPAPSDPPVFGEPAAPVLAPLSPRPNSRSGAIAVREPEPEIEFVVLKSRLI